MTTDIYINNHDPKKLIKGMWRLIAAGPECILELRAIAPKGHNLTPKNITKHFHGENFASVEQLKQAVELWALQQNDNGYNIYVVMNPIRLGFNGTAVTDADIECRDLLLIDIDRVQGGDQPASPEEIDAAFNLAGKVEDLFKNTAAELAGHPDYPNITGTMTPPIKVMSGNGVHLYYLLVDAPCDDETRDQTHKLLLTLKHHFDNAEVKIDTSVYNASRVTKVPGTIMRKGQENPEEGRVFRRAYVCTNA
jgi:hypothetical protein